MTYTRILKLIGIALLIGVTAIVVVRRQQGSEEAGVVAAPASESAGTVSFLMEQQWLVRMKLAVAEEAMVAPQITATGRVVPAPQNQVFVATPVSGILSGETLPRVGQNVARGQVLATLVQTPTAAEASQIRLESARLDAERRRLTEAATEAEVRLNLAKSELDRAARLYERKALSQRQLQSAEADYRTAQSSLNAVNEQMKALEAPIAPADYLVRAPISGTVVEVLKANGEQVAAGDAIVQIVNLNSVWVESPVFERDLARLRPQASATFTTPSFPGAEFSGALVNLGSVINERTRAATAVFEVDNSDRRLRIGMQANIRLDARDAVRVVTIPKEAVLEHEGRNIVYILISGEEFQRREVQTGDEYGDTVAILSGLNPGERVVTQGAYQLKLHELRPAGPVEHTHEL